MANTTASIVANYGQGTTTVQAFHKYGRPRPTIEQFCGVYEVEPGRTTIQLSLQGAALTNAAAAEEDAAVATQALNALSTATLTPASYVSAISPTGHAMNRVDPNIVDLEALAEGEIVYPHERTVAYDASIGIVPVRFAGLSVRVGTAGANMTPSTGIDGYNTLCTQLGCTPDVIWYVNLKQWSDLIKYGLTTSASIAGNDFGKNLLFEDLVKGMIMDDVRYMGTLGGRIHIFLDPDPGQFAVVSSNYIGAMFVPALPGLNGWPLANAAAGRYRDLQQKMPNNLPLSPAFAIGYRSNPAPGAKRSLPANMYKEIITPAGYPIAVAPRAYAGQDIYFIDAWSSVATVEVSDISGVGMRSTSV